MNQKTIFVLVVSGVILLTSIVLQIKRSFFDEPIIITPSPISSSTPVQTTEENTPSTTPEMPVLSEAEVIKPQITAEQKDKLENYLKANLSTLSPAPEVLGGKFYLTEFIINGPNTAQISYEDGHNSFDAEITYEIRENLAYLQNFTIISQNNQQYTASSTIQTPTSTVE